MCVCEVYRRNIESINIFFKIDYHLLRLRTMSLFRLYIELRMMIDWLFELRFVLKMMCYLLFEINLAYKSIHLVL